MSGPIVERMQPEEWERVRTVRLRALADAPDAFWTTVEQDEQRPLDEWRTRLENPSAATFLAAGDADDLGIVTGIASPDEDGVAWLMSMWVDPGARGLGIGVALIEAVIAWAREKGFERLRLEVGTANVAATRLYERMGFVATGKTGHMPAPREDVAEHERELVL
ncbi:MAG: GNAT family N-acetyltransferase [Planctomycetota bacterium]|nr:GNAT family N-acetyltransferase [Planctomycetota bacterium]